MSFQFKEVEEFYPTPDSLLDKILEGVKWSNVKTILEPSAGKGNICDYITKVAGSYPHYNQSLDIDCVEMDADLRKILEGKGYHVVHDNFLSYHTYKMYDLIIMNPPFSTGASHLLKALELTEYGGNVICILNAETIRNPYSNERKMLAKKLDELDADISYYEEAFSTAERKSTVEIAVVKVEIPEKKMDSKIFETLKQKHYAEVEEEELTAVAVADYIRSAVQQYNLEVDAGVALIREYYAMKPHILNSLKPVSYNSPMMELKVKGHDASINEYVECVRSKYWDALFKDERFTGKMTAAMYQDYASKVDELSHYDFSVYNILSIKENMCKNLITGIEDCIIALFDELSCQYAYSEFSDNVHYYNGWCTNKAWYINKKVILPFYEAFNRLWNNRYEPDNYKVLRKLGDIEKALNYLDGGLSNGVDLANAMQWAKQTQTTRKIHCKYFNVSFYKKGTMHIEFTNEELLKKLNIFGSQQKKWLPPAYGKKTYAEMDAEERAVVDEFEGEISYRKTMENAEYYIYNPENSIKMLEVN